MISKLLKFIAPIYLITTIIMVMWVPSLLAAPVPTFEVSALTIKSASTGNTHRFSIEIAKTAKQQHHGLMHRTALPADHGMLFVWDRDTPIRMWMKNTPLPLDMLFIDADGKIISIVDNTTPNSEKIIDPHMPARAVLELLGGTTEQQHINTGDIIVHPFFGNAPHD